MAKTFLIGTHNGKFHADEALACFLLKQLYSDAVVTRTRDPQVLAGMDFVVDVGGVYDPKTHRYDHHQKEFQDTFDQANFNKIRLSSAGLVYRHFGRKILEQEYATKLDSKQLEILYMKMYQSFIMPLDAIDNGVDPYPVDTCGPPLYRDGTGLAARIDRLNPSWIEEPISSEKSDCEFGRAMNLAGLEFREQADYLVRTWFPARSIVEKAYRDRFHIEPKGRILVLDRTCPWKSHLFDLESSDDVGCDEDGKVKSSSRFPPLYILYPESTNAGSGWRIQTVPEDEYSFKSRAPLPATWRGLRDQELSDLTGIAGCVFVHASGFIGGNKTYEGALQMAKLAL